MTAFQKATLGLIAVAIVVVGLTLNGRPAIVNAVPAAVVTNPAGTSAGIQTSGEATIKVKPDIAMLSLGMSAASASAADAQAQVAERVANVLKAAKDLGVADQDVKTYGYNLYPIYQNGYPKITGYTASEQLSFTLRDVTKVGKALDALAGDAGATNASLQFALDDRKPAEAEARAQAIGEARAKAEAMAKAGGVRVGQLLSVTDQASGYPGPTIYGAATATAGKDTQVPVGDLDVVIRVQVQYAIA